MDVEQVNFVQVYVEAGYDSDESKLGFDYDVYFTDSTTIEVKVTWDNPPYVSAN